MRLQILMSLKVFIANDGLRIFSYETLNKLKNIFESDFFSCEETNNVVYFTQVYIKNVCDRIVLEDAKTKESK